jgi:hypothetical protein
MNGPYFGNSKTMIVHDLNRVNSDCKINEVEPENKKYFDPDSIEQALKEGFKKCKCIL